MTVATLAIGLWMGAATVWAETSARLHQFPYRPGDTLIVENDYGRVRIRAEAADQVRIQERRFALSRGALDNVAVVAQKTGDRIFLQTYFYDYRGESAEFDIQLPADANVVVWGANPAVEISGMESVVRVYTQTGLITAGDLIGSAFLSTDTGSILLEQRRQPVGDLLLESTRGEVRCRLAPNLNLRGWTRAGGKLNWNNEVEFAGGHLERQVGVGGPLLMASSLQGGVAVQLNVADDATALRPGFGDRSPRPAAEPDLDESGRVDPGRRAGETDFPAPDPRSGAPDARPPAGPPAAQRTEDYRTAPDGTIDSGYSLKVNVNWTYLNVSVRDSYNNRSIPDLRREDFRVYEDGALQEIEKFDSAEAPFHLLLLLDVSGSTKSFINLIQEASVQFTRQIKANDSIAVAVFNSDVRLVQPFTNDRRQVERSIQRIRSGGGTAFYDALDVSIRDYMSGLEGRKAIVVFSDGVDNQLTGDWSNGSRTTFNELFRSIQEIDTIIYTIFLDTQEGPPPARRGGGSIIDILGDIARRGGNPSMGDRQAYEEARREMQAIADQTGGRLYSPRDVQDLRHVYSEIAEDLRVQYRLGYNSTNDNDDGRWRSIEVRVPNRPEAKVRARKGYYAPGGP